jgi:hypothetical protein
VVRITCAAAHTHTHTLTRTHMFDALQLVAEYCATSTCALSELRRFGPSHLSTVDAVPSRPVHSSGKDARVVGEGGGDDAAFDGDGWRSCRGFFIRLRCVKYSDLHAYSGLPDCLRVSSPSRAASGNQESGCYCSLFLFSRLFTTFSRQRLASYR